MSLSYEAQRVQNIKDNEALLLSLGLVTPTRTLPLKSRPALLKKASNTSAKRQRPTKPDNDLFTPDTKTDQISDDEETPSKKVRKTPKTPKTPVQDPIHDSGARRSLRSSARKSYVELKENDVTTASPSAFRGKAVVSVDSDDDDGGDRVKMRNNKPLGKRTEDPKQFGHIPGVEVGRWWATRMEASTDAVHAPFVAGISGNPAEGAWSVALSGGYADDVDLGTAFTYTGCGGRDLKGTKTAPKNLRTAPQTFDQSFDNSMNAALKRSAETRKPVRVIRGFKLPSPYAPAEGYRYDGLYIVEKAWMAKGLTKGLMVCRYAFKRMEGQGELPMRSEGEGGE